MAGGQLGKMLILAASNWDVKTYVLDPNEDCPASSVCTKYVQGDYTDYDTVYAFGQQVDMITLEIENVNVQALMDLKKEGKRVWPDPEVVKIIQDKGDQKQFYAKHNLPTSAFRLYNNADEIRTDIDNGTISIPFVQKSRQAGYDGRGVFVVKTDADLDKLFDAPSLVEDAVKIDKELAVIVARNERGEVHSFPPVEMEFNPDANLVEQLICPAAISDELASKSTALAEDVINAFEMVGILAVELFLDENGEILINEVAPRAHNSGHHTIESIVTSQYEQQLRAIFDFPLGSTRIKTPSVMINLLGEDGYDGPVQYEGLAETMGLEGVKVHLYGKSHTRPFRKMGHATILGSSVEEARDQAQKVKQTLKVKAWTNPK